MLGGDRRPALDVPVDLEQMLIDRTAHRQTLGTFRTVADAGRFFEGVFNVSPVAELSTPRVPSPANATDRLVVDLRSFPSPQVTVGR